MLHQAIGLIWCLGLEYADFEVIKDSELEQGYVVRHHIYENDKGSWGFTHWVLTSKKGEKTHGYLEQFKTEVDKSDNLITKLRKQRDTVWEYTGSNLKMCPSYYQNNLEIWKETEDRRDEILEEGFGQFLLTHYGGWVENKFDDIGDDATKLEGKIIDLMQEWLESGQKPPPLPKPLYDMIVKPALKGRPTLSHN